MLLTLAAAPQVGCCEGSDHQEKFFRASGWLGDGVKSRCYPAIFGPVAADLVGLDAAGLMETQNPA
jgi:hypothetical protein